MRLFTAIDIPDRIKRDILCTDVRFAHLNWIRPEQFHLTIRFIGEIDDARLPEIRSALQGIHMPEFTLKFDGCGIFPSVRHPQVFWAGLQDSPELRSLKEQTDASLSTIVPVTEKRDFIPHLTLIRFKNRSSGDILKGLTEAFENMTIKPFTVSKFHLFSSRLATTGAIHEIVESYPDNQG